MSGRNRENTQRKQRGFTLTEMMIVTAIALVLAAVAVPNVIQGMRHLRLRNAGTNMASLLQQARQRAVRDNRNYQVLVDFAAPGFTAPVTVPVMFVDLNADGAYTRNPPEPMMQMPTDVVFSNVPPPALNDQDIERAITPSAPLGSTQLVVSTDRATAPTFNPRGVPCRAVVPPMPPPPAGVETCNTTGPGGQRIVFAVYLRSTTLPNDGWAAVTASQGGRMKRWSYDVTGPAWR
jgi:prepilin-type N-terminal cleavage/methylation domain-containing protein